MLECPLRFPSDGPNRNPNRRRRAAFHPPAVSRASPRVPGPLGGALRELVEMEGVPGGSDGGGIGSDWEVGTIVWVRRRNGSWWPGRILGQHELSASHLMSPRSGTPVKLLGREDASVDWYNLEKSKRVKVFRCGEFDACIERAEASQGFPIKKREKYARREDAILHALELEKHMLERRHQRLGNNFSKKLSGSLRKEQSVDFPTTSGIMSDETPVTCKPINYRKVDSTLPRATKGTTFAGKWKSDILFSHEDHKSDVVLALRKKGLQDAGLPAISSKRKLAASGSYGSSKIPFLVANIMHSPPSSMKDMDGWIDDGRSKICLPVERRSQISASKAWEKCRPQVIHDTIEFPASEPMLSCGKILVSGDKVIVKIGSQCFAKRCLLAVSEDCLYFTGYESDLLPVWQTHFENQGFVERENLSPGLLEPYESDLSERLYLDSDVEHDASSLPSTSKTFVSQLVNSGRKSESDRQKLHTQVLAAMRKKNATLLSGQSTGSSAEAGVSRWNLKRKRNIRRISRSAVKSIGVNDVVSHEDKRCIHNVGRGGNTAETGFDSQTDDSCDSDLIEKGPETAFYFTGDVGYKPVFYGNSVDSKENSMDDSDRDSCEMSLSGWDAEKQLHAPRRQWEWPAQQLGYFYSGSFSDTLELRLVDVDLKVHTSYLGERVPLISLMSRLDGKAIVGHPVQIEILSDGFIATLLTEADYGETTAPAGWPTARRTTLSRIPRPHTASSSVEDVEVGVLHFSDHESRVPLKSDRITFVQKGSHGHGPSKKLQKKSSKKASESNLKTRTLSSLAKRQKNSSSHKQSGEASGKACSLGKLIEPGDAVPFVTCVPTKVLFSRILEAVGRSPSTVAMQT